MIGPPGQPGIYAPASAGVGAAYSIELSVVGESTGYEIEESTDGANWTLVSFGRTVSLTKGASGIFYYRGRACNPAGCGANSGVAGVTIAGAPPVPTGLRITRSTNTQCIVAWDIVPGASHYEIRSGTGLIDYAGGISYSYDARCSRPYSVRSCNVTACSAWSSGL